MIVDRQSGAKTPIKLKPYREKRKKKKEFRGKKKNPNGRYSIRYRADQPRIQTLKNWQRCEKGQWKLRVSCGREIEKTEEDREGKRNREIERGKEVEGQEQQRREENRDRESGTQKEKSII